MSYILDALKRADAERERGHVPGLHSQGTPAPSAGAARSRRIGLPMMAAAVAVLLAVAAALWWWRSAPGEAPAPSAAATPPATPVQKPGAVPGVATAPPAPALPILAPAPPPAPPPTAMPASPPRAAGAAPAPALPSQPVPAATNAGTPAGLDGAPPAAATAPASAPPVKVSGVTYSSNASHRMLIANGKVVREGEEIEPGLKVEVIAPRSAILNHRGSRYNINY